ncbi:MAG: hypothetical protein M3Y22_00820 [Pseudomonadota bacterium]|nr:hypothetical protein [Pseudomonadota bacterium]
MTIATAPDGDASLSAGAPRAYGEVPRSIGDHGHVVSWAAIFAGAAGAAALSLILLVLGVGLGLSSVSPWTMQGASATVAGVGAIVWLLLVALIASGMGGYLAGRLRARWAEAHVDEVYFRDTAHGFLAWAIATLATAALLTSAIGSIIGTGAEAGASAMGAAGTAAGSMATGAGGAVAGQAKQNGVPAMGYFTDSLFRPMSAAAAASAASSSKGSGDSGQGAAPPAEVGRIFARSMATGALSPEDTKYVGQLIAQQTGMSQQDAEKRAADTYAKAQQAVQDAEAKAKEAADKARKAAAYASLWLFVSLLLGAFSASLMATFGGRRRDL